MTKHEPPSEFAARHASAQEIYSAEVNNGMIAAGMKAHAEFEAMPEGPRKIRGEMVARIYAAMEATRRLDPEEAPEALESVGR